jgi:hypothetical protein
MPNVLRAAIENPLHPASPISHPPNDDRDSGARGEVECDGHSNVFLLENVENVALVSQGSKYLN